jgi:hypothetical protein
MLVGALRRWNVLGPASFLSGGLTREWKWKWKWNLALQKEKIVEVVFEH